MEIPHTSCLSKQQITVRLGFLSFKGYTATRARSWMHTCGPDAKLNEKTAKENSQVPWAVAAGTFDADPTLACVHRVS